MGRERGVGGVGGVAVVIQWRDKHEMAPSTRIYYSRHELSGSTTGCRPTCLKRHNPGRWRPSERRLPLKWVASLSVAGIVFYDVTLPAFALFSLNDRQCCKQIVYLHAARACWVTSRAFYGPNPTFTQKHPTQSWLSVMEIDYMQVGCHHLFKQQATRWTRKAWKSTLHPHQLLINDQGLHPFNWWSCMEGLHITHESWGNPDNDQNMCIIAIWASLKVETQ